MAATKYKVFLTHFAEVFSHFFDIKMTQKWRIFKILSVFEAKSLIYNNLEKCKLFGKVSNEKWKSFESGVNSFHKSLFSDKKAKFNYFKQKIVQQRDFYEICFPLR